MNKVLAALVVLSFCLAGCTAEDERNVKFNGTEYRVPEPVPDFNLTDQNGNIVSLSDYRGKVVVVAFIFTSCPDVCPAIEHTLNFVDYKLPDHGIENDIQMLSITIDPARDTVENLKNYTEMNAFDWPHLTSSNPDDLVKVWNDWNVVVDNDHVYANHSSHDHGSHDSHNEGNESSDETGQGHDDHSGDDDHSSDSGQNETVEPDTEYSVGHSTVTFILDQDGNKKVAWSGYDWDSDLFIEDLITMVYGSNPNSNDHSEGARY